MELLYLVLNTAQHIKVCLCSHLVALTEAILGQYLLKAGQK